MENRDTSLQVTKEALKTYTNNYYLSLLEEFLGMLRACLADHARNNEDVFSLAEDEGWSYEKVKNYNQPIINLHSHLRQTMAHDESALNNMHHLLLDEKVNTAFFVGTLQPLHDVTLTAIKMRKTFEKLTAMAALRMIVFSEPDDNMLKAFNETFERKCSVLKKHRNPEWDKFYNLISILPIIGLPRALFSLYKRGTWNFTINQW